jgi:hypothetical protein
VSDVTGGSLLIVSRKQTTPSKTPLFLLHLSPEGNRTYVSSLYPSKTGYTFDYLGQQYELNSKGLSISIDLLGQKLSRNVKNDLSQTITEVENRGVEEGGSL